MAFAVAITFGRQVDLQIAIARFVAQVVMPHQTVKVERGRCACMRLNRNDLWYEGVWWLEDRFTHYMMYDTKATLHSCTFKFAMLF